MIRGITVRMLARSFLMLMLAIAAGAAGAASLAAQTTTGSIRGYIRDAAGAPVADAQVGAQDVAMGTMRGTTSNSRGFYNLAGLRPATYQLTIKHIGYAPITRVIDVPIGQTVTLDFAMSEAAVTLAQAVITGNAAATQTSEVGTTITAQQIHDLPVLDRNILDLAKLTPGVTPGVVGNGDKFLSAGGQPAEAVNLFVDGATYKNDVLRGGVEGQDASKGNPFPQGALQEFRVLTQNYKAEYQKASSAIIVATTQSGSNTWQGELFGFGVPSYAVARDAIAVRQNAPDPNYKRLQAGFDLGGPLIKDKLFFFGNYELNARDEPQLVFPGGDSLSAPFALAPYEGQFTSQFREHLGFGKLTWVPTDKSTVDGSVNIRHETDFRGFGGQTSYQSAENLLVNVYTGVANWKRAGDTWFNEAQINGQHFEWAPQPLNGDLIGKNYFGILRIGGRDTRQAFTQNRLSLRNDITHSPFKFISGDHVWKSGVSVDFLTYEAIKDFTGNPIFDYRSDENWQQPFEALFGFGNPKIHTHNTQIGLFTQDDWSVTDRLILNLGIRWDGETNMINNNYVTPQALADSLSGPLNGQLYVTKPIPNPDGSCCAQSPPVRVIDELGGLGRYISKGSSSRPMYKKAFQPRVGASYDLMGDGRTVLFGGAGIYYDRNYWNTLLDEQFRRQFRVLNVQFRNSCGAPGDPPNCAVWDPKYYDPAQLRTLSGTSGLPEVFLVANDLKPPKTYQFSAGVRRVVGSNNVTLSYNGLRGFNGMNFVRASPWGGLGPNYAQAFVTDDRVKTRFNAIELQIEHPILPESRWGGSLAYTLSRSEEQGQSTDIFWGFDDRYPTVGDLPWRRAPGNQTHTIVANGILRLPYDVMFSTIVSLGSGTLVNATDASNGWEPFNQRTYVYAPPTKPFLGIGHVFATQNMDIRLQKDLSFVTGQQLSIIGDLFNAFNTYNYGCYDNTIFPTSGSPNPTYNKPNCADLGRRLQIGLRYGFHPVGGTVSRSRTSFTATQ